MTYCRAKKLATVENLRAPGTSRPEAAPLLDLLALCKGAGLRIQELPLFELPQLPAAYLFEQLQKSPADHLKF
jgi:hypothetical protein